MVVGDPARAVRAAGLLVGDGEVDEVAARAETALGKGAEHDGHRRREVQHVDRAAAPHLAVDQLAAERVVPPSVNRDGDDVGVTHQTQRRGGRVRSRDPRDERGPARRRLEALDLDPGRRHDLLDDVDVADLLARLGRAVVHALVADQLLQQLDGGGG